LIICSNKNRSKETSHFIQNVSTKVADLLYILAVDAEKYIAFIAPEAYGALSS
jgi:hypothetical protein